MQEDRRALGNRFKPGITAQEHYNTENASQGVPQKWGEEKPDRLPVHKGVLIPGQGNVAPVKKGCYGTTLAGNDCKAHPVKGEHLCVGHRKQSDQAGN